MFTVEKGIPIPPPSYGGARRYPWGDMKVGDSIFVPGDDLDTLQVSLMRSSKRYFGRRNKNAKFTSRVQDGGVRIWRVG